MSAKKILVIGGLSEDEIQSFVNLPKAGEAAVARTKHKELGGRGGNIAISIYRSSHTKPGTEDAVVQDGDHTHQAGCVEVTVIAAAANEEHKENFEARLRKNGIEPKIQVLERLKGEEGAFQEDLFDLEVQQDSMTSWMEIKSGRTSQACSFDASNQWSVEHFTSVQELCGFRPDLVVVTMELRKKVVEKIIDIVHEEGIEILLSASPGETLSNNHYSKITHLICGQGDAAKMLGYKIEDVNKKVWSEMCERYIRAGVRNVVLKVGPLGAYYIRCDAEDNRAEGYVSGLNPIKDIIDATGTTVSLVGTYAAEYVTNSGRWDIHSALQRCNKACSIAGGEIGYDRSYPWSDEIDGLDVQPLYATIDEIPNSPTARRGFYARKATGA